MQEACLCREHSSHGTTGRTYLHYQEWPRGPLNSALSMTCICHQRYKESSFLSDCQEFPEAAPADTSQQRCVTVQCVKQPLVSNIPISHWNDSSSPSCTTSSLPICVRQWKMAQEPGCPPLMWETQVELLAPGFSLDQPLVLCHFRKQIAHRRSLSLYLFLAVSLTFK